MTEKQIAGSRDTAAAGEVSGTRAAQQPRREPIELTPPVDIFEDADGITVLADMPGVGRERLDVRMDGTSLVIEGDVQIDMGEAMQGVHADVRATHYRRTFALSNELESERIQAALKDGVLTVRIPKRAEVRPRKIQVEVS